MTPTAVNPTKTPPGVEHFLGLGFPAMLNLVNPTKTPPGVEHAGRSCSTAWTWPA